MEACYSELFIGIGYIRFVKAIKISKPCLNSTSKFMPKRVQEILSVRVEISWFILQNFVTYLKAYWINNKSRKYKEWNSLDILSTSRLQYTKKGKEAKIDKKPEKVEKKCTLWIWYKLDLKNLSLRHPLLGLILVLLVSYTKIVFAHSIFRTRFFTHLCMFLFVTEEIL